VDPLSQEVKRMSGDKKDKSGKEDPLKIPDEYVQKFDEKKHAVYMSGKMIEPIELKENMDIKDIVEMFGGMGYNARRLAEACELFGRMIDEDVCICLTIAGAMTPVGMSGLFIKAIEYGFVDWIVSTGANLYHDTHRAFDLPMVQGKFRVDDDELREAGVARIYDVFIHDEDTLLATDACIINAFRTRKLKHPFSTADIYKIIGDEIREVSPNPDKSFLAKAAEMDVPIYVPSQADSSIGMNLILNFIDEDPVDPSPSLDILESAALVRAHKTNGALEVGGGVPKNFFMQTQPTLWQILYDNKGGHDYFIQITDARPDTGGLSGATPSEAKSWGKVKDARINNVVVYADATIALPLLMAYAISTRSPRKQKRLLPKKKAMLNDLLKWYKDRFKERDFKILDQQLEEQKSD
jgi:deoxyhypusine synthase